MTKATVTIAAPSFTTDNKTIAAQIKSIARVGPRLDALIHATATSIIMRAEAHGDCSQAQQLLDAMPKSGRALALKAWFETFSPIVFVEGKDGVKKAKLQKGAKAKPFMTDDAKATPFWELNPEKAIQPFDFDKAIASIMKRYEDAQKEGKPIKDAEKTAFKIEALRKSFVKAD